MEARAVKGLEIAAGGKITRQGDVWLVPSQHSGKKYSVDLNHDSPTCTCPDYKSRRQKCKHIFAVEQYVRLELGGGKAENLPPAPKPARPTYKQEWAAYNSAQTNEKAVFQMLLYELCRGVEEPPQVMGRPRVPIAGLIFCAALKVYTGFSGRRNMTDVREAESKGYLSKAIHYNTVSKYLEKKSLTDYLLELIRQSGLPLRSLEEKFAVDSTGISTGRYRRWFDVKYGNSEDWHDWIKLNVVSGVRTNIVTAVIIGGRYDNDSPYFKPLVEATAEAGWDIREVSADKEYLSDSNLRLVLLKGGQPYIPFKSNSKPNEESTVWNRMLHFYRFHQDEFNAHYHQRSNVETTFSMIKAKFGEALRSKTETAGVNEALLKVLCHNFCCVIHSVYEYGIDPDFRSLEVKPR